MRVVVECEIERTPRAVQLEGLFDIPRERLSRVEWDVDLRALDEREWTIGLVTGPSGSGKSTIARELWPQVAGTRTWPERQPVIDAFPVGMSIKDVTGLLSSVGFASPPSWLRPYAVLSTGERFRADMALTIAEAALTDTDPIVVDEFTSVVDRQVAQIGSAAIAKTIRRLGKRFVAVTCHEDVTDWLQPDWVYTPATGDLRWRSLQPRPAIDLDVERVPREVWSLFAPHHYLTRTLPGSARLLVAFCEGEPVACYAYSRFVHRSVRNAWESCRVVTLPDWQGVGIASTLLNLAGGVARSQRCRLLLTAAHPAMTAALAHRPEWRMNHRPRFQASERTGQRIRRDSGKRLTASFEYAGPAIEDSPLAEHFRIFPALHPAAA